MIISPNPKTQQWKGLFQGKFVGDFVRAQSIDLEKSPGRLLLADRTKITSDSTDSGLSALGVTIGFLNSGVDGTQKFWAITPSGIFNSSSVSSDVFVADTTTSSPSQSLTDCLEYVDGSGIARILVASATQIYELHKETTSRWIPDYPYTSTAYAFTAGLATNATSGTLTASWTNPTGMYSILFSNNDVRMALFTNGSTTVAWVPAGGLTAPGATANVTVAVTLVPNQYAFTGSISGGDTTGTLTAVWARPSGSYSVQFSNGDIRTATFTRGSLTVTWSPSASGNSTSAIVVGIHGTNYIGKLSNLILIFAGSAVSTVDANNIYTDSRLTMDGEFIGRGVYTGTDRAWFMAQGVRGDGIIYEWDGGNDVVNASHFLDGYPLLGFLANDIPYFVLQDGRIVGSNSKAFVDVAFFPNFEERTLIPTSVSLKGTQVDGDLVYIHVPAPLNSFRMRSGVWVFNTKNYNLYPMYSVGQYKTTNLDFGQAIVPATGGILFDKPRNNWLIGGSVYTAYSGSTKNTISTVSVNDSNGNRGYFITPLLPSNQIQDYFYNLWLRFPRFRSSGNSIVGKYRVVTDDLVTSTYNPIQLSITWIDTTHFSAVLPTGIAAGNEVEVLAGDNSGCLFHISSLSATPDGIATITVTLDEAAPLASVRVALAEFNNWVKIPNTNNSNPITSTTKMSEFWPTGGGDSASGPYSQFKIELRGILTGIDQYRVDSNTQELSGL